MTKLRVIHFLCEEGLFTKLDKLFDFIKRVAIEDLVQESLDILLVATKDVMEGV